MPGSLYVIGISEVKNSDLTQDQRSKSLTLASALARLSKEEFGVFSGGELDCIQMAIPLANQLNTQISVLTNLSASEELKKLEDSSNFEKVAEEVTLEFEKRNVSGLIEGEASNFLFVSQEVIPNLQEVLNGFEKHKQILGNFWILGKGDCELPEFSKLEFPPVKQVLGSQNNSYLGQLKKEIVFQIQTYLESTLNRESEMSDFLLEQIEKLRGGGNSPDSSMDIELEKLTGLSEELVKGIAEITEKAKFIPKSFDMETDKLEILYVKTVLNKEQELKFEIWVENKSREYYFYNVDIVHLETGKTVCEFKIIEPQVIVKKVLPFEYNKEFFRNHLVAKCEGLVVSNAYHVVPVQIKSIVLLDDTDGVDKYELVIKNNSNMKFDSMEVISSIKEERFMVDTSGFEYNYTTKCLLRGMSAKEISDSVFHVVYKNKIVSNPFVAEVDDSDDEEEPEQSSVYPSVKGSNNVAMSSFSSSTEFNPPNLGYYNPPNHQPPGTPPVLGAATQSNPLPPVLRPNHQPPSNPPSLETYNRMIVALKSKLKEQEKLLFDSLLAKYSNANPQELSNASKKGNLDQAESYLREKRIIP